MYLPAGGAELPAQRGAEPTPAAADAAPLDASAARLLLTGEGEVGQQAAAATLLRLLEEGAQLHTLSLPRMLLAGAS